MDALHSLTLYAAGWMAATAQNAEILDGEMRIPRALLDPMFDLLRTEAETHSSFAPREKWHRAANSLAYKMETLAREMGLSMYQGDWLTVPMKNAAYIHWGVE